MAPTDRAHVHYGTLDDARAVLLQYFGYPDFRPPQIRAVQAVLSGHDALLVLPTGGGKSVCYQVPALVRSGLTIVLSPLISLMKDQVDALEKRNICAAFINSTLSAGEVSARLAQAADGSMRLLYMAPERLDSPRMLQTLARIGVSLLAVDEAHCISEWGHDFRPSYRRIGIIRDQLGTPQTVALTATATPAVRDDIARQLRLVQPEIVVAGFDRTNLVYHVVSTKTPRDKDRAAIAWLREAQGPAVVYAPTRKAVERVAATLVRGRIQAVAYHAGLEDGERQRAQDAFMREKARVIVATSAFGMGIDKPNVRLVVHHAMSGSLESYYQEAGRAGRDGEMSTCVLLYSPEDRLTHEFFIAGSHPEREAVEQTWQVLRNACDDNGFVQWSIEDVARRLPATFGDRQAGAALRVLAAANALTFAPASSGRAWVRLLATSHRIVFELTNDRAFDREVLRGLWRAVGSELETGVSIDLDALPTALGGARRVMPVLDRLQSEQFVVWSRSGGGMQLDARCRDPGWLPVDWEQLAKRRHTELSRLEAMQQYAQTRACRRAFVLRYFGDPDVRPQCGACDRCLATPPESFARKVSRITKSAPLRWRT